MDVPTLVAEIRHQTAIAPLHFRGVADLALGKECFAQGRPPVRVTPDVVFDFHVRRLVMPRVRLRLPLVVPRDQMPDFTLKVQMALWTSLHEDPLWIVRDLPIDLKAEGRIVARTEPTRVAFHVDDIRLQASSCSWIVRRVDFEWVQVAALQRNLMLEFLEDWEERRPRWVTC